ncbi:MAG: YbhB/YbcL family Raf kinase inhibitor-like protein [Gemmatimonadota bacterium]|jgi:Raf kinase inhibitor-like YbhB/YbcL family protein|nr:YbhB/YbcL family Raf kinase inhibitor-like protein [Gemmatimonadota bacterium]
MMWRNRLVVFGVAALLLAGGTHLNAQQRDIATIVVESPVLTAGGVVPADYTADGRDLSPPLTWRNLPAGTKRIAVLLEDRGVGNPPPFVHWVIYNIPGTAAGLPEGQPLQWAEAMPAELAGAVGGRSGFGRSYYRGPAPPPGPAHEYTFVVYALDSDVDFPAELNRAALLEAMDGHVIGKGEIVSSYQRVPAQTPAGR